MIRKKIYVAGPMQGYPDFNFPAFKTATYTLRKQGWEVFSPHELNCPPSEHGKSITEEEKGAFAKELQYICEEADAVYMLKGWERSGGAKAEWAAAVRLNHEIIYQ